MNRSALRLLAPLLLLTWLPRPGLAADLYLVGGTVLDAAGPERTANIAITRDRISDVGPSVTPEAGATVIDATGLLITPGLVDFQTTLGLVEIWAVEDTVDLDAGGDPIRAAFRVADALNPQSTLVPVTRAEGVTSVVSHPGGGLIAGQSAWWDLDGVTLDDMLVAAPVTMDVSGGAQGATAVGTSRATAMLRYREIFADLTSYLDNPEAFSAGQMRELSISLLDLEALEPVLEGRLPVSFHANRQADILAGLRLADEFGLDILIVGGSEAWAVADELAARQIPVVINPLRNAPYTFSDLGARADAAAILDRAGVPVILTTGEAHLVRNLRQYAGNAVRAGMDYQSALAAVTLRPAQAAGLDDRYGTVEVGRVANLVVWTGDPFELSTRVRHVVIQGRPVDLETRQSQLFERYRHLDPRQ